MKIGMRDVVAETREVRGALDLAYKRVLDSGQFIGGPEVCGFEAELAEVAGCAHAICVSSGTDALLVSLMALGVGPGDEVITTPFTFFATAGVIARLGARPVFVDIDPATFQLDPAAALAARTAKTRAVIPVHLFGRPTEIAPLEALEVPIVEDAAQSLGAAPLQGELAAVSFFPSKNLGALGDGGAVLTHSADLAGRVSLLRNHGASPKYHHVAVGGNFRLDALQAAFLRVKLPKLAEWNQTRRTIAARYRDLFAAANLAAANLESSTSPLKTSDTSSSAAKIDDAIQLPPDAPDHVYHHFVIRTAARDSLRAHLAEAGVQTEIYYPRPLHLQPCFADLGYREGDLPVAERAAQTALAIPCHPHLAPADQAAIVDHIHHFFRRATAHQSP